MNTKSTCPDCGTAVGQPHVNECDVENEVELTKRQMERQDFVDGAIHTLLEELASKELEWDISLAGAVRDVISQEFHDRGIMTEMEFYPYMEIGDEPSAVPPADSDKNT